MADDTGNNSEHTPRHRPRLSELNQRTLEDDLWDLDDAPAAPQTGPAPSTGSTPEGNEESGEPTTPTMPEIIPTAESAEGMGGSSLSASDMDDLHAALGDPQPPTEAETTSGIAPTPAARPNRPKSAMSPTEKASLGAFAVFVLGLGIWFAVQMAAGITTTRMGANRPDLPAKGQYITATSINSFWRKPIRTGPDRDVARLDISYIPVVEVGIKGEGSGAIRVLYTNETGGDFIGDGITKAFTNGRFIGNGSDVMSFPATSGFKELGEFNSYRAGTLTWWAHVYEGPNPNAPSDSFKLLFKAPISPNRR